MSEDPHRELTVRAIATGFVLGALLVPCNVYSGLKIGWSFNMSVAAALLSYAFWNGLARVGWARPIGLLENNINQTAASSSASIISAGLVAPIPALTLLTGQELAYPVLAIWVFAVSFTGIIVALGVRRQMLLREGLPFPSGVATAETIREIYATGKEAAYRVRLLLGAAIAAAVTKITVGAFNVGSLALPGVPGLAAPANLAAKGISTISLQNLGLTLNPSLLMLGFGMIVGSRVGVSLLLGALLAWLILPAPLLEAGWALPGSSDPTASWYLVLLEWLLWPGVVLMTAASLTSFGLSLVKMARVRFSKGEDSGRTEAADDDGPRRSNYVPRSWFRAGLVLALILATVAQMVIFDIRLDLALGAFALTFVLAIVAARVSGETGIAPIGALGKITQVSFGVLSPGNQTVNLMAANVTGGAAGQCSDLLHDLKTGLLIRATLRYQAIAQVFGVLSGSLAGTAAYLLIADDLPAMLASDDWAMPAVLTWKAVAEAMARLTDGGLDALGQVLPTGTGLAVSLAAGMGVLLAVAEKLVPEYRRKYVPSASSLGFAFIIPADISIALFLGAMIGEVVRLFNAQWKRKYLVVVAAGLVAGESLTGVGESILKIVFA
ncbi:MAG: OPT/YSL family transporter [Opitutales bacterium]